MPPCILSAITDFQPVEELAVETDTASETLLPAILDDTLGVIVGEGSVVGALAFGSGQREGVVLGDGGAIDIVGPVGVVVTCLIQSVPSPFESGSL